MIAVRRSDAELAERHRYRLPNGDVAISVTSICRLLDDGKSMGFAHAAVKLGPDFKKEWDAKAERGSRLHAHFERWLSGKDVDALDDELGYLDALEAFFKDYQPTTIAVERVVLSSAGYGGRFDTIVEIDGVPWIVDLKNGKQHRIEHTMQLAAYRYADGMAVYDDMGAFSHVEPLPLIDRAACLYLSDDGSYVFREYPADRDAFGAFLNLLLVHRWLSATKKELDD